MPLRSMFSRKPSAAPPFLWRYRSSPYYISLVTGMGLLTDVCLFPLYSPALPARLTELGYQDVAALTGWTQAAYAAGLIIATFPFAWLGARTKSKRLVLLGALALMAIGVLIFLLVPSYAAMIVARVLQGASGSGVWVLGLALVADNVEGHVLGKMMGLAMIGYSLGTSIGLPLGGVLYGQLGWKAPSIFALVLIGLDFTLRVCVLEKHEVKRWLDLSTKEDAQMHRLGTSTKDVDEDGKDLATVEAPSPVRPRHSSIEQGRERMDHDIALVPLAAGIDPVDLSHPEGKHVPVSASSPVPGVEQADEGKVAARSPQPFNALGGLAYLLFRPQPLTGFLVSFLNGLIVAGTYNTALVLRLHQRYGLSETQSGLVFFAVAIPAAVISPFAGLLCDRVGPRPLSIFCCTAFPVGLCLLMIEQLPLAGLVVLLCLCGICSGTINAPVMVFLGYVAASSNGRVDTSFTYGGFNLSFSLAAFVGPIMAGQILQSTGTPTGFRIQIGITSALAICCVPLVWFFMRIPKNGNTKSAVTSA